MRAIIITRTTAESSTPEFIALSHDYNYAMNCMVKRTEQRIIDEYTHQHATQVMDIVERETLTDASLVRIINPRSGYEYESFSVKECKSLLC